MTSPDYPEVQTIPGLVYGPPQVIDGVREAIRRQFGGACEIEEVDRNERMAIFGFSVDGFDYSLTVGRTE